jgi:hypothetical protein
MSPTSFLFAFKGITAIQVELCFIFPNSEVLVQ